MNIKIYFSLEQPSLDLKILSISWIINSKQKKDHISECGLKNGGYDETWTCDPRIMSAVL